MNFEEKVLSILETISLDVAELKADVAELKADVAELKADVAKLKADVAELKLDVIKLKTDVALLKADVGQLKTITQQLDNRLSIVEKVMFSLEKRANENGSILAKLEIKQEREVKAMFDYVNLAMDKVGQIWDKAVETDKEEYGIRIKILEERVAKLEKVG